MSATRITFNTDNFDTPEEARQAIAGCLAELALVIKGDGTYPYTGRFCLGGEWSVMDKATLKWLPTKFATQRDAWTMLDREYIGWTTDDFEFATTKPRIYGDIDEL